MNELNIVKIVDGPLHPYLKDIEIIGRVQSDREQFYVFGCKKNDEKRFYRGILNYDKMTKVHGLKTVKEVEEFWINGCDGMFLAVEKSDYEVIE